MNEEAMLAIGAVLNMIGATLDQKGICTVQQWAATLAQLAITADTQDDGHAERALYLCCWAALAGDMARASTRPRRSVPTDSPASS